VQASGCHCQATSGWTISKREYVLIFVLTLIIYLPFDCVEGKTDAPIDKVKYDKDLLNETYKLFAEVEKRRVQLEERDAAERKRKREQELGKHNPILYLLIHKILKF
jgi:hypothetical protein